MGTKKTRAQKQRWFENVIRRAKDDDKILNKEKLISSFCLDNQTSRKTALEFLKLFVSIEKVIVKGKEVWPKEIYDAERVIKKNKLNGK